MVPWGFYQQARDTKSLSLQIKYEWAGGDKMGVVDVSSVHLRRGRASNTITITLSNADNSWDFLHLAGSDIRQYTGHFYWTIWTSLFVWNEYDWNERTWDNDVWEPLMIGRLEEYSFDEDARTVTLKFADRIPSFLDIAIGSSTAPVDYTDKNYTVPEILLDLLTIYAGLIMGTDIDTWTWDIFAGTLVEKFPVRAFFTGESLAEIMESMQDLMRYDFIFGKDSKLYFVPRLYGYQVRLSGVPSVADFTPDESTIVAAPEMEVEISGIINRCEVWYKTAGSMDWNNFYLAEDLTSQGVYGLKPHIIKHEEIWPVWGALVQWDYVDDWYVDNFKYPREKIKFGVNLHGLLVSPENALLLYKRIVHRTPPNDVILCSIEKLIHDFQKGMATIETTIPTWT